MGISPGSDQRFSPTLLGIDRKQIQHGPDTLGGAFGRIKRSAAEKITCIGFAFSNNSFCLVQTIRTLDFRNIQMFHSKTASALMPRHVQPAGA